ncbi:hypothetical protein ELI_1855 [Eubacterium callanderi]|uniref:Uncharacterized protein n=1 Tax=Eubacterium callanderi TaxID=53442 RepID=E3GK86_9FIRM|nr:hypothetical protein ELI_1855 [Eubacterium callanderi]
MKIYKIIRCFKKTKILFSISNNFNHNIKYLRCNFQQIYVNNISFLYDYWKSILIFLY